MSVQPGQTPAAMDNGEVARAVSLFLGVAPELPGVYAIAQRIASSPLDPRKARDANALSQSYDFQALVMSTGGDDLARLIDPARKEQLRQEMAAKSNVTSSDFVAAMGRGLELAGLGMAGLRGEGGSSYRFSASLNAGGGETFSTLDGASYYKSPAGAEFIKAGLDYSSFAALRGAGFDRETILKAATLGTDPNRTAKNFAIIGNVEGAKVGKQAVDVVSQFKTDEEKAQHFRDLAAGTTDKGDRDSYLSAAAALDSGAADRNSHFRNDTLTSPASRKAFDDTIADVKDQLARERALNGDAAVNANLDAATSAVRADPQVKAIDAGAAAAVQAAKVADVTLAQADSDFTSGFDVGDSTPAGTKQTASAEPVKPPSATAAKPRPAPMLGHV